MPIGKPYPLDTWSCPIWKFSMLKFCDQSLQNLSCFLTSNSEHPLVLLMASCKWRDAQRAMRNRRFIGYTLRPLERNVRGRLFESEGGCQILFGQILYFRHGLGPVGKLIFMWHGLGKIYFCVNMVNHSPLRLSEAITINSNVF